MSRLIHCPVSEASSPSHADLGRVLAARPGRLLDVGVDVL